VETGSASTIRNYAGNKEFDSHQLDFIGTSEGRITGSGGSFSYEYFLKDHLGNVRVIFGDDGNGEAQILQEDHYYPYGMISEKTYSFGFLAF